MSENQPQGDRLAPITKEITLKRPIKVGGEVVDAISLREPTLADAEFLDKVRFKFDQEGGTEVMSMGTTCSLAAQHLGGLTKNEAAQLCAADCMAIFTAVMVFLNSSQGTGAKP